MLEIVHHLNQDWLRLLIGASYQIAEGEDATVETSTKLKEDIKELLFIYLTKFNIRNDLVPICKTYLTFEDVHKLRKRHLYNYNKLNLVLKFFNQ